MADISWALRFTYQLLSGHLVGAPAATQLHWEAEKDVVRHQDRVLGICTGRVKHFT